MAATFEIEFPDGYFPQGELEAPDRGCVDVVVTLGDGSQYELSFYDMVRLGQTLDLYCREHPGRVHYADAGMVVVTQVTTENVKRAVSGLLSEGFFKSLRARGKRD